jgi:hypothetical protein
MKNRTAVMFGLLVVARGAFGQPATTPTPQPVAVSQPATASQAGNGSATIPAGGSPVPAPPSAIAPAATTPAVVPASTATSSPATPAGAAPVITSLSSTVYPPDEPNGGYSFSILGDHFGTASDTTVEIAQRTVIAAATDCSLQSHDPCIKVTPHVVDVYGYTPGRFEGPAKVTVIVGNLRSEAKDLTFSHYRVRLVRFFAFLGTALIALLVYLLVRRGVGSYRVGRERFGVFSMFIIDKDTHSYSLSKLQLLLWTCAAVFTYIYFYLCRILIQWSNQFPDVPPGMPMLLGLSAGTTVVAIGLTAARGPKGAGPLSPTPADFISSGGVVNADRLQFFVWTVVGVLSFVGMVLNSDPAHLSQLPEIPNNFLALMGVSSAGYLAAKAARRPGPVISHVDTSGTTAGRQLAIKIDGQNLDETATIRIDNKVYNLTPDAATRRAQDGGGSFYTHLEWILAWEAAFDASTHVLEIVNQDGQVATSAVALKPFRIVSVAGVKASKAETPIDVTVTDNLGAVEAEWSAPGTVDVTRIPAAKIVTNAGVVTVTLTPGETTGAGRLALIDTAGQRALATVNVT